MKKSSFKIVLTCALMLFAFGGVVAIKQINSKAASPLKKVYFRLGENAKEILTLKTYTPQGMCINGNTAYVAILKRPKINGVYEQRIYIYKIENISSSRPKVIQPTGYIYVGHANGIEYRNGDLYIASCDKNLKGIYRVGMQSAGTKMRYFVRKKYDLKTNSTYNVFSTTYAKSIAYYKTISGRPNYIIEIGQSSNKVYLKYIVGYFRESDSKFITTNYFTVKKPGDDYKVAGEQAISCINVKGRVKLVTSITCGEQLYIDGKYWNIHTRNLGFVTDVTSIGKNAVKYPEQRIGINSQKYYKYEIEALAFKYENGKYVPYGLFNIWEKNDKNYHNTKLYRYNYSL